MADQLLHAAASQHNVPSLITAPGETDVLVVAGAVFLVMSALRPRKQRLSAHRRLMSFNSFHAGARTNPINGIEAAPIASPTIPDRKAITVHFTSPAANGSE